LNPPGFKEKMRKRTEDIQKIKLACIWGLLMFIFIAELLFYTWCRVQCIQMGYEISYEAKQHQELISLQNNLRIELAHLKSPERIAKIAKYQIGLSMPATEQIVIITP